MKRKTRLDRYADLLLQWQAKTNLISPATLPVLWTRHISDSLQLLNLAPDAKIWLDFGSGGGFPGRGSGLRHGGNVQVAIVHLVERNAKKAAFLREAVRCDTTPTAQCIWLTSGIMWIEFRRAASIASPRGRWLHYISFIGFAEPLDEAGRKSAYFSRAKDVDRLN